jgi:hypothetical protein
VPWGGEKYKGGSSASCCLFS